MDQEDAQKSEDVLDLSQRLVAKFTFLASYLYASRVTMAAGGPIGERIRISSGRPDCYIIETCDEASATDTSDREGRMFSTTNIRSSRMRNQRRPSRIRNQALATAKRKSSVSLAYAIQGLSIFGLSLLFISTIFFPLPGGTEHEPYGVLHKSIVRKRIEALRGEQSRSAASINGTRERTRRKLQSPHRRNRVRGTSRTRATAHLDHAGVKAPFEKVQLDGFKDAWRVGLSVIAIHSEWTNRFDIPWLLLPRITTRSFAESGYRVLYSPMKEKASGGIGHGLTVLNAELSTAITLGLSYTHRVGIYGSMSRAQPLAVEDLFGWGAREVPRKFIQDKVCEVTPLSHKTPPEHGSESCPVCRTIRKDSPVPIRNIVEVPSMISYGCTSCHRTRIAVGNFLAEHGKNHTLFQMLPSRCDRSPKSPDFSLSYRFFYWKYWDLHGNRTIGGLPVSAVREEGRKWTVPVTKRGPVNLIEDELNIVIHARRGDFFTHTNRKMVSAKVFAAVANRSMEIVQKVGGIFSEMPVAIILYSEGRERNGTVGELHEQSALSKEFVDTDGTIRDAIWLHSLFMPCEASLTGNSSHTDRAVGSSYPNGLRVETRISSDVVHAIHEMAAADIFIGSASDLSQYAVRVISRAGMQILPEYQGAMGQCCATRFDVESGRVLKSSLEEYWRLYSIANEESAIRSMKEASSVLD